MSDVSTMQSGMEVQHRKEVDGVLLSWKHWVNQPCPHCDGGGD